MSGCAWIRRTAWSVVVPLAMTTLGCILYRYQPVTEIELEDLADRGCDKGDRVTTRAELNKVYEDAMVLWDGRDPDTTVTVGFAGPGVGGKTKGVFGENRYERAYDALRELAAHERPLEVTIECRGERRTQIGRPFRHERDGRAGHRVRERERGGVQQLSRREGL